MPATRLQEYGPGPYSCRRVVQGKPFGLQGQQTGVFYGYEVNLTTALDGRIIEFERSVGASWYSNSHHADNDYCTNWLRKQALTNTETDIS